MANRTALALSLVVLTTVGCNTPQEGAEGNVLFTPDECGRLGGCDFADSIGAGGTIQVHISGIDGFSTAGVTLASDDLSVLDVVAVGDNDGRPTWEATGLGEGVARILAIDADDDQVDFLEVGVQELSGLTLDNFLGEAVGPTSDPSVDEVWTVNADQNTSFYVTPLIGEGVPTMGVYDYVATVDEVMEASLLENSDLAGGYLYFNAPAGDYQVTFESSFDDNVTLDVLIIALAP